MAETTKYLDWSFLHASTEVPFVPGTLAAGNDKRVEELMSGRKLAPDLMQVTGKKPFIKATLLDPSICAAWTAIGSSPATITATWRTYLQDGGLGASYKSLVISKGILIPLQLSAGATKAATLDVMALAAFSTGTGITFGTSSATGGAVAKAYYPTTITVGSAVGNIVSVQNSWNYAVQDDDQLEPSYYYYDKYAMTGNAVVKDLAQITSARLEDGSTESVTLLFTDANNGANTVTVTLGNCKIHAEINGDTGTISWSELAA
jgi:hypothetical protein